MIYLKATLIGMLWAAVVGAGITVLFAGGTFWLPLFALSLLPNAALTVAFVWAFRRAQRPALKWTVVVVATIISLLLFIGIPIWNMVSALSTLATADASGSGGIGAVSIGISELFVETIPSIAFVVGFLLALPVEERPFGAANLRLYTKATALGLLLGTATAIASSGPTANVSRMSMTLASALAPRLSIATPEYRYLLAVSLESAIQGVVAPLPLVAFALGLWWTLSRARQPGRYAKAFLSGLLWLLAWRLLAAPLWTWQLYAVMARDEAATTSELESATGLGDAELLTALLLGGLSLLAFVAGAWWSLGRNRSQTARSR